MNKLSADVFKIEIEEPFQTASLTKFYPEGSLIKQSLADAMIAVASKTKDWPTLEHAVDVKIEDQTDFVRWWNQTVRSAGRKWAQELIGADRGQLERDAAEEHTGIKHQQVSRWAKALKDKQTYRAKLFGKAYNAAMAMASEVHVENNSGENEWYTPQNLIEAARAVMGSIDCDPASSEIANKTVLATVFFTAKDNGLSHKWNGNVWMNPPYAQPLITEFSNALAEKFEISEFNQACVLVNNATETSWFYRLARASNAICFTRSRIKFIDENGDPSGAPLQGQAIIYFGTNSIRFAEVFSEFGYVYPIGPT